MADTRWWTYVQRVTGGASPAAIARAAGLDRSAPTRWSNGGGIEAPMAVKFARAYHANVLEALAAAGYIDESEVDLVEVSRGVEGFSSVELLRELLRRAEGSVGGVFDAPEVSEYDLAADDKQKTPDEDLRTP